MRGEGPGRCDGLRKRLGFCGGRAREGGRASVRRVGRSARVNHAHAARGLAAPSGSRARRNGRIAITPAGPRIAPASSTSDDTSKSADGWLLPFSEGCSPIHAGALALPAPSASAAIAPILQAGVRKGRPTSSRCGLVLANANRPECNPRTFSRSGFLLRHTGRRLEPEHGVAPPGPAGLAKAPASCPPATSSATVLIKSVSAEKRRS